MADESVWATSLLGVFCVFVCLFVFSPSYVAFWDSKTPHRPTSERVSCCLETSPLSWLPSWDWSPSLTLLSLFLSFIFYLTSFQREWAAFLGAWCPLPAFRSCFVEVAQHLNDLLMNLLGRKWSPHPIPLPSWDRPPPLSSFCLSWHLHLPKSHIEYGSASTCLVLWILHGAEFSSQPTLYQEHTFCRVTIWSCNPTHGRISRQNHNSKRYMGICLVVQWLRLSTLQCGGL